MDNIEAIAKDIVDAAYRVRKEFGPGLLESAYQQCHVYELRKRGRQVLTEFKLPMIMMVNNLMMDIELMNW